jgi:hypothetical protein
MHFPQRSACAHRGQACQGAQTERESVRSPRKRPGNQLGAVRCGRKPAGGVVDLLEAVGPRQIAYSAARLAGGLGAPVEEEAQSARAATD